MTRRDDDAVLVDLAGLLTKTASVHAAAWKPRFDGLLERRAADTGEAFVPFEIDADYRRSVDGKPRYDGVAAFLKARGSEWPWGTAADPPGSHTVQALGNLKAHDCMQHLERHGAEAVVTDLAQVQATACSCAG
jgi:beta-phosphoglucomutase-like phosphatase (HAD superfamily)